MELIGATWRKSTHSGSGGGDCIEIADNLSSVVAVRDSKDSSGPILTFTPQTWRSFLKFVKD